MSGDTVACLIENIRVEIKSAMSFLQSHSPKNYHKVFTLK